MEKLYHDWYIHYMKTCLSLTHKQLVMYRRVLSTVATDVVVLKHQAISIHNGKY